MGAILLDNDDEDDALMDDIGDILFELSGGKVGDLERNR